MDRVLYVLRQRCCDFCLQKTSRRSRRLAEHTVLVLAVCGFGALLLAHLNFVQSEHRHHNIPNTCLPNISGFQKDVDVTHLIMVEGQKTRVITPEPPDTNNNITTPTASTVSSATCNLIDPNECQIWDGSLSKSVLFSYSREKGYLELPHDKIRKHNISVQYVLISKNDTRCFGEPFLQELVFGLLGPDTVMINWLLGVYEKGFIYNPRSKVRFDIVSEEPDKYQPTIVLCFKRLFAKGAVVIKTSFVFFITTTLVSFILRETQARVVDTAQQLLENFRNGRPVISLVTTHVQENLVFVPIMVGMIFCLTELVYRGDWFLTLMVLILVWVGESFSFVSLRTQIAMHFFPRIFYLLFAIFHFYTLSFPFGFSYTALITSMCFMLHSMLFFWHRYELPKAVMGRVVNAEPERRILPPMPIDNAVRNMHVRGSEVQQNRNVGTRSHSFNQSTSGLLSRNSSMGIMFQGGGEDDDESYACFLEGEVVLHRSQHQRVRASSPFPGIVRIGSRQRFVNELEAQVPSHNTNTNSSDGRIESRRPSFSAGRSYSGNGSSHRRTIPIDEQDYARTSSLQAVLNHSEHDQDEGIAPASTCT